MTVSGHPGIINLAGNLLPIPGTSTDARQVGTQGAHMGYFDALANGFFKEIPNGRVIFYPWAALGRGYELPTEEKHREIRQFVKRYFIVIVVLGIILGTVADLIGVSGWLMAFLFPLTLMTAYQFRVQSLTRDLRKTDQKLSLLESYRNQAASLSMAMLWLMEIGSILIVFLGVGGLLLGIDPLLAIAIILIFGGFCIVFGYMIRTKRDLARQQEGVEPSEPAQTEETTLDPTRTHIPSSRRRRAHPQEFIPATITPKSSLPTIIGKSIAWGFAVGLIVFVAFFFGPMLFNPGSNLAPIGGILFGPPAFVIGTFLAGICQIRRALTLPKWGKVVYGLFLLVLLVPFALVAR
jgi:hypothetical protein